MNKKVKGLIIGGAAVVVLVAVLLLLMFMPNGGDDTSASSETTSSSKSIELNNQAAADVVTVKVVLPDEEYTMTQGGETAYSMTGMEDAPASNAIYAALASDAASLKALELISEETSNLADYGLDEPRSQVEITYADGTGANLSVGIAAPSGSGTYVLIDGKVYLFEDTRVDSFLYHKVDYISKTVTPTAATGDDAPVLKKITLEGTLRPEPIVMDISQETANDVTTDVYTMTAPKQRETDSANAAAAGNKIFRLTAEKVIAFNVTDEQLEEYGLKDPYSKVTVDYADQTITLMSSEPDDEGMAYVMNASKNVIFQANVSELGWVTATYEDLVSKTVMAPMVNDLSKITVTTPDQSYEFGVTTTVDEEDEDVKTNTFTYQGKELASANFRIFYRNMIGCQKEEFTDQQPTGEPLLTFQYEYTDGRTPDVVEFYKGENLMVLVSVNGECESKETQSYVDKILEDVVKVVNDEEVKEL